MVRGDENLRFTDAELAREGLPARRPFRRRPAAPQYDPDIVAGLYGPLLVGLLIAGLLAIGFSEHAKSRSDRAPAQYVHGEPRPVPANIPTMARRPNIQSTRAGHQPPSDTRVTSGASGVHIWSLKGLDGETYVIADRPGELPSAPPGFRAAYAFAGTRFYDAPQGNLVGRLAKTTPVLHTIAASEKPSWRWSVTADGTLSGFVCFVMPGDLPPPPALDIAQPRDPLLEAAASHLPVTSAPRWPRQFACADASGRFQRITSGPLERQALHDVPLCDERAVPKRAYTIDEVTQMPRLLHKVAPEYTEAARLAKYQGTVFMHVLIDEQGVPTAFWIIRSLGLGLDENAVKAVRRWSCRPAYRGETPVPMWVPVEVNFRLL